MLELDLNARRGSFHLQVKCRFVSDWTVIFGHSGAGKSTLLKILSQVTLPSSGQIKIRGRIASLLEVGTGFHHDLTGREKLRSRIELVRRPTEEEYDA